MPIEVDENGTLDLSMKKGREVKAPPQVPLGDATQSPPESTLSKQAGSVHISPAFYQALCERDTWDTPLNFSKAQHQIMHDREVKITLLFLLLNTQEIMYKIPMKQKKKACFVTFVEQEKI